MRILMPLRPARGPSGSPPPTALVASLLVRLFHDHEQVAICHDRESGLRAIIAVHDTTLGPGLGGIRMSTCRPTTRHCWTCCACPRA